MTAPFDLTQIPNLQAIQAADLVALANTPQRVDDDPQFIITVYDNRYNVLGEAGDYISCTATFAVNDVGTATIVLKGDDPLVPYVMQVGQTVVPITIQVNNLRWSGRVDTAEDERKDGVDTVTLQCKSDYDWLNHILVWPDAYWPIEVQPDKQAIYIGPGVSVMCTMLTDNLIRLNAGLWEIVNNILDPLAWFATAVDGLGLLAPVVVVPPENGILGDTSKWVAVTSQMATVADLAKTVTIDNGIIITADLWLPGESQPTTAFTLTVPTVVVKVVDHAGLTGYTGTLVDGLLEEIVDVSEGLFGEAISPFIGNQYAPPGVDLAAALGYQWKRPWAIYTDHPRSGVKEFHLTGHAALCHTVVSGGRSPQWVNKLIDTVLEFALSEILAAIGASGIASTLLDGVFDDIILSYQEIENAVRRGRNGPYCYPEVFVGAGSVAYTLSEFFTLFNAMWDTRGYYAWELLSYDGIPYSFGYDIQLGDLVSWVRRGQMFTDYLLKATVTDDRSKRVEFIAQIGDNKTRESPFANLQRLISGAESAINALLLAQN